MVRQVTVVIPAYNQARFLDEAIASVLSQNYDPLDVVVVDDGSTDDTARVAATFPAVRYIAQQNSGVSAARNRGLAASSGELIVFLDADDRLLPGALAAGARVLAADPALGFAAGYSRFITRDGTPQPTGQPRREGSDPYLTLLRRNRIRNPAMVMFRRDLVARAGGFDTSVNACADYDLYLRISRDHPVAFHDQVVADYRKHGENMSDNAALMMRQLVAVMRRQRPHLTTGARRDAWRDGIVNIRSYYGDRIVTQLRDRVRRSSGWRRTIEDVATLLCWHPGGVVEHARRKALMIAAR